MAAWESFQLTTISHDLNAMATAAARLLVARLSTTDGQQPPQRIVMEPRLIERGTLAPPSG